MPFNSRSEGLHVENDEAGIICQALPASVKCGSASAAAPRNATLPPEHRGQHSSSFQLNLSRSCR